jgi:hypothetical protein
VVERFAHFRSHVQLQFQNTKASQNIFTAVEGDLKDGMDISDWIRKAVLDSTEWRVARRTHRVIVRDRIFRLACVAYMFETTKFLMLRPKIPQSRRV